MIYSYKDIQERWNTELKTNSHWSVFLLPEKVPYFSEYISPKISPYLKKKDVIQYLINFAFVFGNDNLDINIHIRLMMQHKFFLSIPEEHRFANLIDIALEKQHSEGFKPNAIAASVKNPYYKFDTFDKNERKLIYNTHRASLKIKHNVEKNTNKLIEFLEDYNLDDGLLTKSLIQNELKIGRHILKNIFAENESIQSMYNLIRSASITSKRYIKNKMI